MMWDCPSGTDETHCSDLKSCPGNFNCHKSMVCVNISNICDGVDDCAYGDDEFFCSSSFPVCPHNCTCLLFTISCHPPNDSDFVGIDNLAKIPYLAVIISVNHVNTDTLLTFLGYFPQALLLSLQHNAIEKVCNAHINRGNIYFLDVSYNSINKLEQNCFQNIHLLLILNIRFNKISEIKEHTFNYLTRLETLDISSNQTSQP